MLSLIDNFFFEYFSNKQPDFSALDAGDKNVVLDVALSYPDLFAYIRPHLQANLFYDEANGRGNFGYYPHYFLVNFDNAKWFVENCIHLRESFFIYSDWFHDDEGNLEARSQSLPSSLQKQHYTLLTQENDHELSFIEIEQIIDNVVKASQLIGYTPQDTGGILEVIEEWNGLSEEEREHLTNIVASF